MKTVTLKMNDLYTGKTITREMDISVLFVNGLDCWEVAQGKEKQKELLENWISDRGNQQHDTELELIDWVIS